MVPSKVEEYQRLIRRKLGQRLEYCAGNVVVLFDELQKAAPGTLDGKADTEGGAESAVWSAFFSRTANITHVLLYHGTKAFRFLGGGSFKGFWLLMKARNNGAFRSLAVPAVYVAQASLT